MKCSIVVPVFRNEASLPRLLAALTDLASSLPGELEVVFVVDGSPDQCFDILRSALDSLPFAAQLIAHSRNFGSLAAIRTGLAAARGDCFAGMAADLQEPPELLIEFFRTLAADECDVVIGTRDGREDPWPTRLSSGLFWSLYRRLVVPDMPAGGVDVFGCNRVFRDHLLSLEESRSSLIALIFWLGFRRRAVGYRRLARREGRSAWTLGKKVDYLMDSVFAFTDYPIRLLIQLGALGLAASAILGLAVLSAKLSGAIAVPGYAATMLVVLIFGALNLLGLGLVGTYAWRGYENSKRRPQAVIAMAHRNGRGSDEGD